MSKSKEQGRLCYSGDVVSIQGKEQGEHSQIKAASLFLQKIKLSPSIPSAFTADALASFSFCVLSSPAPSLLTFLLCSLLPSPFLAVCNDCGRSQTFHSTPFPPVSRFAARAPDRCFLFSWQGHGDPEATPPEALVCTVVCES